MPDIDELLATNLGAAVGFILTLAVLVREMAREFWPGLSRGARYQITFAVVLGLALLAKAEGAMADLRWAQTVYLTILGTAGAFGLWEYVVPMFSGRKVPPDREG